MFAIDRKKKAVELFPISSYSILLKIALASGKAVPLNLGDLPMN